MESAEPVSKKLKLTVIYTPEKCKVMQGHEVEHNVFSSEESTAELNILDSSVHEEPITVAARSEA
jgi:hypothetical protein